jgi:hypothetical protein
VRFRKKAYAQDPKRLDESIFRTFHEYGTQLSWARFSKHLGDMPMTRSVALRAFILFTVLTLLAGVTGLASQAEIAEVVFLISASLSAILLLFAVTVQAPAPVPVRVRRRR